MNLEEIQKEIIILKEKVYDIKRKKLNEENALQLVTLDRALGILMKHYVLKNNFLQ